MGDFGLLGLQQQMIQSQQTLQNGYNQQLLQQQQSVLSGLFTPTATAAAQGYTYTMSVPYGAPSTAPARDTNEAWLDRRVNEMRVKL